MTDSFVNFEIYKDLYAKPCKRAVGGLFGSFHWKISGSNVTSKKVVLLFQNEYSKRDQLMQNAYCPPFGFIQLRTVLLMHRQSNPITPHET